MMLYLATYPKFNPPILLDFAQFAQQHGRECTVKPWQEIVPERLTMGDVVLPLAVWDYSNFPRQYQDWLERLEARGVQIFNSRALQLWNMKKTYLAQFHVSDHQVSKNIFLLPEQTATEWQQIIRDCPWENPVCKPLIGQSGKKVRRFLEGEIPTQEEYPDGLVLQPYIPSQYEVCFIFVDGKFSHAIERHPDKSDWRANSAYNAIAKSCENAEQFNVESIRQDLWAVPEIKAENPLYLRADALLSQTGELFFNEIEVIEPSLYLDFCPKARESLLRGIERRLQIQSADKIGKT